MALASDAVRALAIYGDASLSNVKGFLKGRVRVARRWPESSVLVRGKRAGTGRRATCYVACRDVPFGLVRNPMDQDVVRWSVGQVASDAGVSGCATVLVASITENQDEDRSVALMEQSAKKASMRQPCTALAA
jgi:hypothetical protein